MTTTRNQTFCEEEKKVFSCLNGEETIPRTCKGRHDCLR